MHTILTNNCILCEFTAHSIVHTNLFRVFLLLLAAQPSMPKEEVEVVKVVKVVGEEKMMEGAISDPEWTLAC